MLLFSPRSALIEQTYDQRCIFMTTLFNMSIHFLRSEERKDLRGLCTRPKTQVFDTRPPTLFLTVAISFLLCLGVCRPFRRCAGVVGHVFSISKSIWLPLECPANGQCVSTGFRVSTGGSAAWPAITKRDHRPGPSPVHSP